MNAISKAQYIVNTTRKLVEIMLPMQAQVELMACYKTDLKALKAQVYMVELGKVTVGARQPSKVITPESLAEMQALAIEHGWKPKYTTPSSVATCSVKVA